MVKRARAILGNLQVKVQTAVQKHWKEQIFELLTFSDFWKFPSHFRYVFQF